MEKLALEMVGGEKHINPHYDIKVESTGCYLFNGGSRNINEYIIPKELLGLWKQTICEIRSEIKTQETPALVYAKELCDKLEHSICALVGGSYNLTYSIIDGE